MDDLSQFITEEIYVIDGQHSSVTRGIKVPAQEKQPQTMPDEKSSTVMEPVAPAAPRSYGIGVVTGDLSDKDKELLGKILGAVKVEISDTNMTQAVDQSSNRWLIFDSSVSKIKTETRGDLEIIHCLPLSELHENVGYKKELWGVLKNHFDI